MLTQTRKKRYTLFSRYAGALLIVTMCGLAMGSVSVTMKGRWLAECSGVTVSEHNRYDKALESVFNNGGNCDIIPPDRFEVRSSYREPEAPAEPEQQQIAFTWNIPTRREDGTNLALSDISGYIIRWGDGEHIIEGSETVSKVLTLPTGSYSFTISTITTDGTESAPSAAITI